MFSPDRLAEAQRRAQTGGMGALSPSKVAFARGYAAGGGAAVGLAI
jgi:hypothetical protein